MKGQENEKLIEEFRSIKTEAAIKQWEKAGGKDKIKSASSDVRDVFDSYWKSLTGGSYFTAITDIETTHSSPILPGRINPKSVDYKTSRVFHTIMWSMNKHVTGKGMEREEHKNFDLSGLHGEDNRFRIIVARCKPERLRDHLGEEVAATIIKESKKGKGEIIGLELPVLVEGYWEVLFAGKGTPDDKEDPEISVEGHCLQVQRDVPTILPGDLLRQTTTPHIPFTLR